MWPMVDIPHETTIDWFLIWTKFGWVDIVFVIAFVIGIFLGFKKSLSGILPRVLGLVISLVASVEYYQLFGAFLHARVPLPLAVWEPILFSSLAFAGYFLVELFFLVLSSIATIQFKNPVASVGGAVFGGIGSVLFFGFLISFLLFLPFPSLRESIETKSLSGSLLAQVVPSVHQTFRLLIPAGWRAPEL